MSGAIRYNRCSTLSSRFRTGEAWEGAGVVPRDKVPSVTEALDAHVAAFQAHEGPIYGLQGWTGPQILGGAETTATTWHADASPADLHQSLSLKYLPEVGLEAPDSGGPFVRVTTTDDPRQSLPWHLVVGGADRLGRPA